MLIKHSNIVSSVSLFHTLFWPRPNITICFLFFYSFLVLVSRYTFFSGPTFTVFHFFPHVYQKRCENLNFFPVHPIHIWNIGLHEVACLYIYHWYDSVSSKYHVWANIDVMYNIIILNVMIPGLLLEHSINGWNGGCVKILSIS